MAQDNVVRQVPVQASVAAGAAVYVGDMAIDKMTLWLTNGTASVQFQMSADGTNWASVGAAFVNTSGVVNPFTDGTAKITGAMWVRANTTAYTSGTPVARVVGAPQVSNR